MKIFNSFRNFFRRETVLCVCAFFALLSMLLVPPSAAYAGYIDIKVLCLLFSLMAVILGLQECGLFKVLAHDLLISCSHFRVLSLTLVLLTFFCSMLVTNDVALITFIPFTLLVLKMTDRTEAQIRIIVLQTIAANLGSMATPFGSPHNLYLYSYYGLSAGNFFALMLPVTIVSLVWLVALSLRTEDKIISVKFDKVEKLKNKKLLYMFLGLFVLSILSVFRVLPYWLSTAAVFVLMLIFSRKLLIKIDYYLLATFICFFVFAGNMGQLPQVREFLGKMLMQNTVIASLLTSQLISNVPASMLLCKFTNDWQSLVLGINIGGLGTPIASLASLISLELYMNSEDAKPGRFMGIFMFYNIAGILLLLLAEYLIKLV